MRTLRILALASIVAQIAVSAEAALAIHSDEVADAARKAKQACAAASQTAQMRLVDRTVIANFERLEALCGAAAGIPVPSREWPKQTPMQSGLPYGATGLFDAQNLSEGFKALYECQQLAERRAAKGKASLRPREIGVIAEITQPATGLAVFDPEATVAFVEIRLMCADAVKRIE